jgi:hypothetical protein
MLDALPRFDERSVRRRARKIFPSEWDGDNGKTIADASSPLVSRLVSAGGLYFNALRLPSLLKDFIFPFEGKVVHSRYVDTLQTCPGIADLDTSGWLSSNSLPELHFLIHQNPI